MRACIKMLGIFLVSIWLCFIFPTTAEAGLLDIPIDEMIESTVSAVEVTVEETVQETVQEIDTVVHEVEEVVHEVEEVLQIVEEVSVEVESVLDSADSLLSENGLTETVDRVTGLVNTTLEALHETIVNVVQDTGDIVENVEPATDEKATNESDNNGEKVDENEGIEGNEGNEGQPEIPKILPDNQSTTEYSPEVTNVVLKTTNETMEVSIDDKTFEDGVVEQVLTLDAVVDDRASASEEFPDLVVEAKKVEQKSKVSIFESDIPGNREPVRRKGHSSVPPVIVIASWYANSRNVPTGNSIHGEMNQSDWILAEHFYFRLESRRHSIRYASMSITQWANAPPTQPPKHFLFSA